MFSKLIWSDEFNYVGVPNTSKWAYELGGSGWGNDELQYYTDNPKNAFVKNGMLHITAINEPYPVPVPSRDVPLKDQFTSARLVTKGKATFKYGRIEVRAKLPIGVGVWSAFWLFGRGEKYSEIDIMENVGYEPEKVWFSTHSESGTVNKEAHNTKMIIVANTNTVFKTYSLDWTPEYIIGYVDGVQYFSLYKKDIAPELWTFDDGMFLIFNLAVGGSWGGYAGIDHAAFPQTIQVNYVRVYAYTP